MAPPVHERELALAPSLSKMQSLASLGPCGPSCKAQVPARSLRSERHEGRAPEAIVVVSSVGRPEQRRIPTFSGSKRLGLGGSNSGGPHAGAANSKPGGLAHHRWARATAPLLLALAAPRTPLKPRRSPGVPFFITKRPPAASKAFALLRTSPSLTPCQSSVGSKAWPRAQNTTYVIWGLGFKV